MSRLSTTIQPAASAETALAVFADELDSRPGEASVGLFHARREWGFLTLHRQPDHTVTATLPPARSAWRHLTVTADAVTGSDEADGWLADVFDLRVVVAEGELRWNQQTGLAACHRLHDHHHADGRPVDIIHRRYLLRGRITGHTSGWARSDGGSGAAYLVPTPRAFQDGQPLYWSAKLCVAERADPPLLAGNVEVIDELLGPLTT